MNNTKEFTDLLFNKFTILKQYFDIKPKINSKDDFSTFLGSIVTIKHIYCGHEEEVLFSEWINKKNIYKENNNPYISFCTQCSSILKTKELQEYLSTRYNDEFELVDNFQGYQNKIQIKHKTCNAIFYKTPAYIKANGKRLICPACKKSDSIYEQKCIEDKNKSLKTRFEKENITTYVPLENCVGFMKKMKFKHLTCGEEFIAAPHSVYKYFSKHDHCPNCLKNKITTPSSTEELVKRHIINLKSKYRKFIEYSLEFDFLPEIKSFEDFLDNFDKPFTIVHKKCNTKTVMTFSQWSKQRHYSHKTNNTYKFIHFCEHCSERLNRENLQKFLNKKFNKEFEIVSKYKGTKSSITIKHIKCGATFNISPSNLKRDNFTCRHCGKRDIKTENFLQNKKNKELLNKLKKEKLNDFVPLEDYKGASKLIKFKHLRCGNEILTTPNNLLRLKNKNLCSCCPEKLISKEIDINKKSILAQKALDIINNSQFKIIDLFDDNTDIITLKHENCNKEFPISTKSLFLKKIKCPHCESNNFKNNRYISLKSKINAFEEHLNFEYKILTPFLEQKDTVAIQHIKCGHIFKRTIVSFMRSKNKMFCPKCKQEEKFKEIKEKLYNKYQEEFQFYKIEQYKNTRNTVEFIHNDCGTVFESNLDKMLLNKTSPCPKCNDSIKTEQKFKNELYSKFKGEYLLIGEYKGNTKKTSFRHKECNKLFVKTPYNVLNSDIPCSHCIKENTLLGLNKAQEKIKSISGDLFTLNGIYRGTTKDMPITCNNCKTVFISTPKRMFMRKKCPICGAKETKKD